MFVGYIIDQSTPLYGKDMEKTDGVPVRLTVDWRKADLTFHAVRLGR